VDEIFFFHEIRKTRKQNRKTKDRKSYIYLKAVSMNTFLQANALEKGEFALLQGAGQNYISNLIQI
jgi:hypothetical protein